MNTLIRPYRNDDWDAIRTIYDVAKLDEMRGSIENLSAILPLAEDTRRLSLFRESIITVAEDADQVIGFAGHKENYISWMFVHPGHRRKGVAIDLLRELLPRLGRPVTLNVGKNNLPARRLYEELGFVVEKDFIGQWDNGEPVAVLTLRLDDASHMTLRPVSDRLEEHAREWAVSVDTITQTDTSLIAWGTRLGNPVVLKVARREGEEWRSGEILAAFDGHGLVRALEFQRGAVLLERLEPGDDLSSLSATGRDDEATEIIAGVIEQMSSVRPALHGLRPVQAMVPELGKYRHTCEHLMSAAMIDRAEQIFVKLCESQTDVRILHGDLHHYNVLLDSRRGWVAIDPWGLRAEIEFEIGASLRNPASDSVSMVTEGLIRRRLAIYERRLGINVERAVAWAFSQTVLAALWPTEEGIGQDLRVPFIAAAHAMMPLVRAQ